MLLGHGYKFRILVCVWHGYAHFVFYVFPCIWKVMSSHHHVHICVEHDYFKQNEVLDCFWSKWHLFFLLEEAVFSWPISLPISFGYKQNGMLLLHGHGMPKMKHVEFVGWPLMVVVLTVNSLGMIAHWFGVHATMLSIFIASWNGLIHRLLKHIVRCAVVNGSSRDDSSNKYFNHWCLMLLIC